MTTLLIGNGMVGSKISKTFQENQTPLIVVDKNLYKIKANEQSSLKFINKIIKAENDIISKTKKFNIKKIILAAGVMSGSLHSNSHSSLEKEANLISSLLRAVSKQPVERVIFVSSFAVYGSDNKRVDTPPKPKSNYGLIKLYNEELLKTLSSFTDLVIVRPVGILGPIHQKSGNWMSSLLKYIYYNKSQNHVIENLKHANDVIDIRDVSNFVYKLVKHKGNKSSIEIYNVGRGEDEDANDLIAAINSVWNRHYSPVEELEVMKTDVSKSLKKGLKITFSLEETIKYIGDTYEKK